MSPAFQHAKKQLLQPFRFGQWVRLAFVGLLAGEMGSGGGCNFNFPWKQHPRGSGRVIHTALPTQLSHHLAMSAGLIALLVVGGICLFVLLIYVSSVMRFILFDSVVNKECRIRKGWLRHSRENRHGWELFVWHILLMMASVAGMVVLIGIPVACALAFGWFTPARAHVVALVLGGGAILVLFLALILVLAVVHVMTKDFVVPQMALENISAMEGWRRLWLSIKSEKASYGGYIGLKIVLAIGAGVVLGIVTLIVMLMLLIPIGGFGAVAVLGGKAAGFTWNFYTIALAVVAGCIAFAFFFFAISFISAPATVFFPAYSIYFFAPRYAPLAAVLWPRAAAPIAPSAPSMEPPPVPPTSAPLG